MFSRKSTGKKKKRKVKAESDSEDEKAHFLPNLALELRATLMEANAAIISTKHLISTVRKPTYRQKW